MAFGHSPIAKGEVEKVFAGGKINEAELRQFFNNHFSCYADTTDESTVLTMDQDRFVEVVLALLAQKGIT